ncbi:MAG: DUF3887 domain-containing protein [Lachnospiraceae bacterium]|nr:DUF3887 domain-containing protein [Lachnospiraceae bacterium]
MKKIISLFTALCLCMTAAACKNDTPDDGAYNISGSVPEGQATVTQSPTPENPGIPPEADYEQLVKRLGEQMANGEFSEVTKLFSDTVKASLPETSLSLAWAQTVADAGDYIGYYDTTIDESNGMTTVVSLLEFSETGLCITYYFGTDGKIEGLWLRCQTLAKNTETEHYTETAVVIGSYELNGLLTLPKDIKHPPIVILIQGSGPSDMDETVNDSKPFRDIAHGLAENGVAVLRFNKRFYQHPEAADTVTIQTEVLDDVTAAIDYASACSGVDSGRIYLLGHSLGGMLVPVLAGETSAVKGIISLAGTPRKLEDIICDQNNYLLKAGGLSDDMIEAQMQPVLEEAAKIKNLTEDDRGSYFGVNAEYWYSLNRLDTATAAQALEIPMLFLQGSEDIQVYADVDFAEWQEILKGKSNCTFHLYEGLGHFFVGDDGFVDANVIEDIAAFILNNE